MPWIEENRKERRVGRAFDKLSKGGVPVDPKVDGGKGIEFLFQNFFWKNTSQIVTNYFALGLI